MVKCRCCGHPISLVNMNVYWATPYDICMYCEDIVEGKPIDPTQWEDYNGCTHKGDK